MKKQNKIILVISILIMMISFAGCNQQKIMEQFEEENVRVDAENIMDAIEEENDDYLYDTYFSFLDKDEFESGMKDINSIYKGEMTDMSLYNVNVRHITYTTKVVTYLVKTDVNTYTLTLTYVNEGDNGYILKGANVSEFLNYIVNAGFANYTVKNWILFALNVISYGIMITALILCIKTKIKKKALWIILILLQTGITITRFPNSFNVNYSFIWFFGGSRYLLYAHGGTVTSIFIHVFAVVFLLVRKNLNKRYLIEEERKNAMIIEQEQKSQQETQNIISTNDEIKIESKVNSTDNNHEETVKE